VGNSVAVRARVPRHCHASAGLRPPSPLTAAFDQIEAWAESPSLLVLAEGPEHWATLRPLIEAGRVGGPKVHDARIAALCLAHGVQSLWTVDRDFSRFPALQAVNPLSDESD
jgi:hypothetical protein